MHVVVSMTVVTPHLAAESLSFHSPLTHTLARTVTGASRRTPDVGGLLSEATGRTGEQ